MRVAVLGGGLCGLAAARELTDLGADSEVFEAAPDLGGLVRSRDAEGAPFDVAGGHYLPMGDPKLAGWVDGFLPLERWRIAELGIEFQIDDDVQRRLPALALAASLIAGLRGGPRHTDDDLGRQLEGEFGRPLARRWLQPWAEQLWDEPVDQLHGPETGPLLPGFPSVGPVTPTWLWENRRMLAGTRSSPLGYPIEGMAAFVARLARGLTVHRQHRVRALTRTDGGWQVDGRGPFDGVVSTLPADQMVGILGGQLPTDIATEALALGTTSLTVGCFDRSDVPEPWTHDRIRYLIDGGGVSGCHRMVRRWHQGRERVHVDITGRRTPQELQAVGVRFGLGRLVDHAWTSHAFPVPHRGHAAVAQHLASWGLERSLRWIGRWSLTPSSMPSAIAPGRRVGRELVGYDLPQETNV